MKMEELDKIVPRNKSGRLPYYLKSRTSPVAEGDIIDPKLDALIQEMAGKLANQIDRMIEGELRVFTPEQARGEIIEGEVVREPGTQRKLGPAQGDQGTLQKHERVRGGADAR